MAVVGRFKGTVVQATLRRDGVEVVLSDGEREVTVPLLEPREGVEQPQIGDELIVEVKNA